MSLQIVYTGAIPDFKGRNFSELRERLWITKRETAKKLTNSLLEERKRNI
jgi:hypothetical protein